MRIVFMGTPDFAVAGLRALLEGPHDVIAVYSQPPRPKGRGQQVQPSPVQQVAESEGIPVYTPLSFKKDPAAVAEFASLNADLAVVAAYGLILPRAVLEAPRYGCLNIHASLLPRWRGASPIQHAIWKGDSESGVTIMQMEEGLDTGPMLRKEGMPIGGMTASDLHDALAAMGGRLIAEVVDDIAQGRALVPQPQDDGLSNYAPLLKKEDGRIDWTRSVEEIDRQVRALNPWPGTYAISEGGKRLKILAGRRAQTSGKEPGIVQTDGSIICGDGTGYLPLLVQPENGRKMDVKSSLNGGYLRPGTKLQ